MDNAVSTSFFVPDEGLYLGRVWNRDQQGPSIVTLRDGQVVDITSKTAPLVRDVCEMDDPVAHVRQADGVDLGSLASVMANRAGDLGKTHFLAPCDLQAVKACGVTFASSMVERVIEERAAGDPALAEEIRSRVGAVIGDSLRNIEAGSAEAAKVKQALIGEGLWSQYLEVGIG
ncbi:MAG: fumarylacetoacetate hydrolase, partial [Stappiaceae bacterium]